MHQTGKRFIVTGGCGGIGASVARYLVRQGAVVAIFDIKDKEGISLVNSLNSQSTAKSLYLHVDVSNKTEVELAVKKTAEALQGLDGLAHTAGIESRTPLETILEEEWDRVLDINLKGTFLMNQAVFPYFKENGGGVILNMGSDSGLEPLPPAAHYSSSKGGVHTFTRAASVEWGKYNIRVNALLPLASTPMVDQYLNRLTEKELEQQKAYLAARIPLGGGLGDPDTDVTPMVAFLLSDASRFVTGQLICVNGGFCAVR
ncbi:hypothetical protein PENARI_c056G05674 [Penicillium arizonense]|uniref:Uncharacterized protein n=1 Tax=Penicillium arizonense TaxID=1835702 RepID=A0A1F5L1V5_PENAI|nr:hypothetical protein PENARI_c056G05674 [Penicillium arizonense]OGE47185.1 hypothetical protein PENARI_c056G05674 [Penicillium arizonense]